MNAMNDPSMGGINPNSIGQISDDNTIFFDPRRNMFLQQNYHGKDILPNGIVKSGKSKDQLIEEAELLKGETFKATLKDGFSEWFFESFFIILLIIVITILIWMISSLKKIEAILFVRNM